MSRSLNLVIAQPVGWDLKLSTVLTTIASATFCHKLQLFKLPQSWKKEESLSDSVQISVIFIIFEVD